MKLSEDEIETLILTDKAYKQNSYADRHFAILNEKALREKNFDIVEHVRKLTGNDRLIIKYKNLKGEFEEEIKFLGHAFGAEFIENVEKGIEKKFGKDFVKKNQHNIDIAMTTGDWTWKVLPEFIDYYLRECT